MILTLVKLNGGFMIVKPNTLSDSPSLKLTIPQPLLTRQKPLYIKLSKGDHFHILAKGKTDYHCKTKETLFIQELESAFNVNERSEKLMLHD